MRSIWGIAVAALVGVAAFVVSADRAIADKRVALVVGIGGYKHAPSLASPTRDAKAIAQMFEKAGFDTVQARYDLSNLDFKRALRDFLDVAKTADIAVVFFAGHGIQVGGQNYMIPVDAQLARDVDTKDEAISLERIVEAIEPATRLRLVILDACRDNPFIARMQHRLDMRVLSDGLTKTEPISTDTLIAYAAKAGSTADDGNGDHSPFTAALLKHITEPGLDVRLAFGRIRDEVRKVTRDAQEPFVYGSLGGTNVSLVPPPAIPKLAPFAEVKGDYELVERVNTKKAWEVFINQHKQGTYVDLAKERLKTLENQLPQIAQQAEEQKRAKAEQDRLAASKAEEDKKQSEAKRLADQKAAAEAKRLAEEKVAEAERVRKGEEARKQTEAKKLADEKAAAEAWSAARDTTSIGVLEVIISRYPGTFYADMARARTEELKKQRSAAVAAAPAANTSTTSADKRIALLIGNKDYKTGVGALVNPINDIRIVGDALKTVGFEVLKPAQNASRAAMLRAIHEFAAKLKAAGADTVGFLYYSGHGIASAGENYLIPVDVEEPSSVELAVQGVRHSEVLAILRNEAPNAAHYLVLDACRHSLQGSRGGKGFVPIGQQSGVLVAFAAEPGKTASDTGAGSGPYAAALAAELVKPGQSDLIMFHRVRVAVMDKTNGDQVPWTEDGIQRRERVVFGRGK